MLNNWIEFLKTFRGKVALLNDANPTLVKGYKGLGGAALQGSALDAKTKELIALAVAVTTRCDGCISSHVSAAVAAGATREELGEALGMAISLNAGAAFVYSVRAMEAFDQFEQAEAK
jgi:AhpD family alkylhydroperoxidase